MCGRYTLTTADLSLVELFELTRAPELEPRYNIAPTQPVAVLRAPVGAQVREIELLRWGLIPSWAKDPAIGNRMINARSETAEEKPSFRSAMRRRRCLIPADGFYEWKKTGGRKQPFYIRMADQSPFAMAGLWEQWQSPDGTVIESCTILTTLPNELLRPIHDRMPVILPPRAFELWLEPDVSDASHLKPLLCPFTAAEMSAYPIGTQVNSPSNDTPACIKPLG
jgi:putative SOS response-associated peptidase YedK